MGKRSALAIAGAVATVGVAIGWRASKKDQSGAVTDGQVVPDPNLVDGVDPGRFVQSLAAAITHNTVVQDDGSCDSEAFIAMRAALVERYPNLHAQLSLERFNDHALLFTWAGADPLLDPIVLMGHQDVVPVESGTEPEWDAPPFAGEVTNGRIYGRGALDCKGPLIAVLEAVEFICEKGLQPDRTVLIVSGHDEEIGGTNGAQVVAEALDERGITPWFVVDEGGAVADGLLSAVEQPVALVGIAEKGYMNVRLTVRGEGGHSSMPPKGTAVAKLAEAISALEANPMPPRIDAITPMLHALSEHVEGVVGVLASKPAAAASLLSRVFARDARMDALQRTTIVPTVIEGGLKANVIPQSASVVVNVRIIPGDTCESALKHIQSVVGSEVQTEVFEGFKKEPSVFSSTGSEAWETITGVIEEIFPAAIIAPYVLTGGTDSRFFSGFSGDVYRFSPFVLDSEAMGGFHGTNEYVEESDAAGAVSFFVRLIAAGAQLNGSV